MRFLFDECVALRLVGLAHARGHVAYHVAHRGLAGTSDATLLRVLFDEDLVLVTNNGPDFTALLCREEALHPGLVSFVTQTRPSVQAILFVAVLDHLEGRVHLMNRLVEVDVDPATRQTLSSSERLSEEAWLRVEACVRPVVTEVDLPP